MPDVVCLGEMLIDFCAMEKDVSLARAGAFAKAPGGAPANVAVGAVRLGGSAGFIGAVGADPFGQFLQGVLADEGVDTSHMARIDAAATSLAFIAATSDGRKEIAFSRQADMHLGVQHIDPSYIRAAGVLHFGSISRIDESPRAATDLACKLAKEAGAMISYDPNWRPALWPDHAAARQRLWEGFRVAAVAKVSDEEWAFITGAADFASGAEAILAEGVRLVIRSEGAGGASFATARCRGHVPAFTVPFVEATGAGDAFMACAILELLAHWRNKTAPADLDERELTRIIRRANAVGALATTKVGAIPSLPTTKEVDAFLKS